MLYVIGGPGRVGKSTLGDRVKEANAVSVVSTDTLVWSLEVGAPELGVRHGTHDKATSLFPFLAPFVEACTNGNRSLLVEGDAIRPAQVRELDARFDVRACFLGNITATADWLRASGGWVTGVDDANLESLAHWVRTVSDECRTDDYPYFDVGELGYEGAHEACFRVLTA